MRIKSILWAIENILDILFTLYHELWHWLACQPFVWLGIASDVTLTITSLPSAGINSNNGITTTTVGMSITHYTSGTNKWREGFVTFAPVIGVIVYMILMPWYMCLMGIPYINRMWLSPQDIFRLRWLFKVVPENKVILSIDQLIKAIEDTTHKLDK